MIDKLIELSPATELRFPYKQYVSVTVPLRLTNIHSTVPVAFKIKTTSPKSYLVKPSTGVLQIGEYKDIEITLHPLTQEPTAPSSDRFLVQATLSPDGTQPSKEEWGALTKDQMQDVRLRVSLGKMGQAASDDLLPTASNEVNPSTNIPKTSGSVPDTRELSTKYDEMVSYSQSVLKLKAKLEKDLERLKQQQSESGDSAPQTKIVHTGFDIMTVIGIVVLILGILHFFKLL